MEEQTLISKFARACLTDVARKNDIAWCCYMNEDMDDSYDKALTTAITNYITRNSAAVRDHLQHLMPVIHTVTQFEYYAVDLAGTVFENNYTPDNMICFLAWISYVSLSLFHLKKLCFPEAAIQIIEDTFNYFIEAGQFYGRGGWNYLFRTANRHSDAMLDEMVFYDKNYSTFRTGTVACQDLPLSDE